MNLCTYLDRFDVLLVIESHVCRVQSQKVSNLVGHIGSHCVVAAILEPHLEKALFGPQRQRRANDFGLFKLLTCIQTIKGDQKRQFLSWTS